MTPPTGVPPSRSGHHHPAASTSTWSPQAGAAPASVPWLPRDVVLDILSRMTVMSLWRLRWVCREWHAIISDPAFLAVHRSRAEPQPLLVVRYYREEPVKESGMRVMDLAGNVVREIKDAGGFWTSCPTIDDHVCVTESSNSSSAHIIDLATGAVLVNCPKSEEGSLTTHYTFGFGRATPSDTYKVIRLIDRRLYSGLPRTCEVLELGGNAGWRQSQSPRIQVSGSYHESSIVTVNGTVHFLAHWGRMRCFNLESEKWMVLSGPMQLQGSHNIEKIRIAKLKGALCMVHAHGHRTSHARTDVWIFDDYEDVWEKAYTIPMAPTADNMMMPLMVISDDEKLLFYCFLEHRRTPVLQVYDPQTKRSIKVMDNVRDMFGGVGLCRFHLEHFLYSKSQSKDEISKMKLRIEEG